MSSSGYLGVLELDPKISNDSIANVGAPALEVKLSRIGDHLLAEWLTEDGKVIARVFAGKA